MTTAIAESAKSNSDAIFSRRAAIGIVATCTISFLVFLFAMSFESEDESLTSSPSAHSISALGHRAFIEFLRKSGISVRINHNRRTLHADAETAILVAEPGIVSGVLSNSQSKNQELSELYNRLYAKGTPLVLVLPKWTGKDSKQVQGRWISRVDLLPAGECENGRGQFKNTPADSLRVRRSEGKSVQAIECRTPWGRSLKFETAAQQFLRPRRTLDPIVTSDDGSLVAQCKDSRGNLTNCYVVSDPDLFNNHGLSRGDNAELMLRFLQQKLNVRRVIIDEIGHGFFRESSFMSELMRLPMVLIVAHGLLMFGLVAWMGTIRFGKSVSLPPRLPSGKAGLIENTANLLSHRGRFHASVQHYFDNIVRDVGEKVFGGVKAIDGKLIASLQEVTKQKGIEIDLAELRDKIRGKGSASNPSVTGLLQSANSLYRWRQEMLHGR